MNTTTQILLVVSIGAVCYFLFWWYSSKFNSGDDHKGQSALLQLEQLLKSGKQPEHVSDDEIAKLGDNIYIIKCPNESEPEGMNFFHAENTRYWPYYYYSTPYNYRSGGAWPPGMYSRLYNWYPGYATGSGWKYYLRPGISEKFWNRNRWIRNTQNGKNTYYYVTNRGDYKHDARNYADTGLSFA